MKVGKMKTLTPYIKGSRIPITYFFSYIEEGYSLSDFLASYPWIKREDVIKKLDEFKKKEIAARYAF